MKTRGERARRSCDIHLLSLDPIATSSVNVFSHAGVLLGCIYLRGDFAVLGFYLNSWGMPPGQDQDGRAAFSSNRTLKILAGSMEKRAESLKITVRQIHISINLQMSSFHDTFVLQFNSAEKLIDFACLLNAGLQLIQTGFPSSCAITFRDMTGGGPLPPPA